MPFTCMSPTPERASGMVAVQDPCRNRPVRAVCVVGKEVEGKNFARCGHRTDTSVALCPVRSLGAFLPFFPWAALLVELIAQ